MKILLLSSLLSVSLLTGCARTAIVREGLVSSSSTIMKQHLKWATMLANGQTPPAISQEDLKLINMAHDQFNAIVEDSRKQDH